MDAIRDAVLRLVAFSAAAGIGETLLPEGKARRVAEALWSLLALRLLAGLISQGAAALLAAF